MVRVTFWLQLLLLVLILKQSDADSDHCTELKDQLSRLEQAIARTTELKNGNESLACQCYENWAKEICKSQKTSSEVKESEPVNNDMKKQQEVEEVLESNNSNQQQLQTTSDGATSRVKMLNKRSDVSGKCSTNTNRACRYLMKAAKTGDVNGAMRWVNCVNDNCARHGANITPLIYAARSCHLEVVRVLLEGGADVEARVFNNNTALHYAAFNGCVDECRLLLDWGAKVDPTDELKDTPLHLAAWAGHLLVVKLLVERGANVSVRNVFGRNASDEARTAAKEDVAEWLDAVVKKCGLKENACRSLLEAAQSGGVDSAKPLAMCDSSDNCTDDSFLPVTPPTHGPHPVHVGIASEIRRLKDRLAGVKAHHNSPVTKPRAVMPNDYDQTTKEIDDKIPKEFEEQTAKKFEDKIAKEFEEQTAMDDMLSKLLEKSETFKLNEKLTEIREGNKDAASNLDWEGRMEKILFKPRL